MLFNVEPVVCFTPKGHLQFIRASRPRDWINLARDGDSWWAFLNAVMNLQVPTNVGEFLDYLRTD
jgi:hypothetical protein